MRVAHFGKYAFTKIGGVERHVRELTCALAACGIDVTVFSYNVSGGDESSIVEGVRVESVPVLKTFNSQAIAPKLATRARKLAREKKFDVVHQHWPDPFAHLAAMAISGRPAYVVTWHSDIVRQRALGAVYRKFASQVMVRPNAIIGATKAHLKSEQMQWFAPMERRHVIPFGIDVRRFEPSESRMRDANALRAKYGGSPLIFALGRHVYYKGFDVLIRAMERVPAVLLLGSDGPLTMELRKIASGSRGRVEFIGPIAEHELPSYYYASSVFCLPSVATTEAFGLVQAEALACGRPVVNTYLGNGVNELAPHNVCAVTVPPANEKLLAEALCSLLADPARAEKLGLEGRRRVIAQFSVDVMVQQTIKLYESVVDENAIRK